MMPRNLRNRMFESMSNKTMRKHFHAVTKRQATGLVAEVLKQSETDFFINGTITCHAACPELMAGMWSGGREVVLVSDRLPAWLKKAMGAMLSKENQCPYCEDMLVGLTYGAKQAEVAASIRKGDEHGISDERVRKIMEWVRASVAADSAPLRRPPFDPAELPEAIGTLLVFSYTNKITDFTIEGSPVSETMKGLTLRVLGGELAESARLELEPGRSLTLLPSSPQPPDLGWADANPRVSDAISRWIAVVDSAVDSELEPSLRRWLQLRIDDWRGGAMPLSRAWVENEVASLGGADRAKARAVLLVMKASYQMDDSVIDELESHGVDEAGLIKLGAWAALSAARRVAAWTAADSFIAPAKGRLS